MAGITGLGGSGMDIDSTVKAMVQAEQAPKLNQLTTLEKKNTTQLTSLGQLKGAISSFQTALTTLNSPSQFLARTATSSDDKVLTAKASQTAAAASYDINVTQLAKSSKIALGAISSDESKAFNTGTLSISLGNTKLPDITIDSSNNTLAGVRDAINAAGSSEGVSATIITDSQGSRLVLSSTKTGAGNDLSVTAKNTGTSGTSLSKLAFDPSNAPDLANLTDDQKGKGAGGFINHAQSAKLTIDGLSVESETNSVSSAVSGLSLELKATGASTLKVAEDTASVKANITKFTEAYNTLISFVNSATKVTPVTDTSAPVTGALTGDSSVRSLVNTLRSEMTSPAVSGSLKVLADLGVTTQSDGTLKVDSTKLDKAIAADFSAVSNYFTGDTGLATRLNEKLKPYTDSKGILETRTDALEASNAKVDKEKIALQTRMAALSERLYKQFNAMDAMFGQLSATSNSLTQLFDQMPGFVSSNKK